MSLLRRHVLIGSVAAVVCSAALPQAWAQSTYPTRPVRVVVPFSAGGGTDIFARLTMQKLSERLGQQFYIENIGGASGNIGTGQAARAAPDGQTLLITFNPFVVNPLMFTKVPYDPVKDFEAVTLAVTTITTITVNPSVPA